jgi:hypothetical protein
MSDFPPNSMSSKEEPEPEKEKEVKQVTSEPAKRRKKTLGSKVKGMFVGGDARSAGNYVVFDVLVPAAKDTIVEAGSQMIERLIFGESRKRRGAPPQATPGYTNYNQYSMRQQQTRPAVSRTARAHHDFDEIVLPTRAEAEEVLERLFDIISRYEQASVADLYVLVGVQSEHTDHTWGWSNIRGSTVSKLRGGGYVLDLPDPQPLR